MNLITKEKHYNTLNNYYREKYNKKVAKIPLDGNFTCPNKDGKKGVGGCIYCSLSGSGEFNFKGTLKSQFFKQVAVMEHKWKDIYYIPYLQANTNTYKPLNELKKMYEEIISFSDKIVGLDIATRADCLPDDLINYLSELNKKIPVTIELGLQTSNEETGKLINRCLTNAEFENAIKRLDEANISVFVHIINGLPNETQDDYLNTIKYINSLNIKGIKIHNLLVLKNTRLEKMYKENPFPILSLESYVDIVCKQIALLRKDIIICRLQADGNKDDIVTPLWSNKKLVVMNEIDKYLRKNNIYQGMLNSSDTQDKK